MRIRHVLVTELLLCTGLAAWQCSCAQTLSAAYEPSRQVSGLIRVWGSPQMGPLLDLYEQSFRARQPGVTFQNELHSTLTAVSGVYTGRAEIGLLGREMWPTEREAFVSMTGHAPLLIPVATGAFDVPKATFALMIFVAKGNPVSSLTIAQLARIFSSGKSAARTWGDLGLKGQWAVRPIHLYGFAMDNDKAMVFRDMVFPGQHWSCALHAYGNDAGGADAGEKITRAVAADADGIGISNVYYAKDGVKMLAIAAQDHDAPVVPTRESVAAHTYPLFRSVYAVVDQSSAKPLTPQVAEFLSFILSQQGAQSVLQEGNYLPLSALQSEDAAHALRER